MPSSCRRRTEPEMASRYGRLGLVEPAGEQPHAPEVVQRDGAGERVAAMPASLSAALEQLGGAVDPARPAARCVRARRARGTRPTPIAARPERLRARAQPAGRSRDVGVGAVDLGDARCRASPSSTPSWSPSTLELLRPPRSSVAAIPGAVRRPHVAPARRRRRRSRARAAMPSRAGALEHLLHPHRHLHQVAADPPEHEQAPGRRRRRLGVGASDQVAHRSAQVSALEPQPGDGG